MPHVDVTETVSAERPTTRSDVDERTIDRPRDRGGDARALALAAAIEAMSSGHVRVLAAELRSLLEDAAGEGADVIPMRGREPKR